MLKSDYLTSLTPLRGIAALFVIIFHCDLFLGGGGGLLISRETSPLLTKGYLMVDFFFVLSGFIMGYVYFKSFEENGMGSFRKFIVARFARIYPLHVFTFIWVLVIYAVANLTGTYHEDWVSKLGNNLWAIPSQLLLVHSMHLHNWTTWNGPSWSISVEWWVYMLFPTLVFLMMKTNALKKVLVLLVAWAGMWLIVLWIRPTNPLPLPFPIPPQYTLDVTADFGFLRCLFEFAWGVVFYQLFRSDWGRRIVSGTSFFLAMVAVMFVCMHFDVYDTFTVITFPFIILSAAYNTTGVNRFFQWRPMQVMGDLSFSMYLTHFPVFGTVASVITAVFGVQQGFSTAMGWFICFVWIVLTLLVSAVTYKYIELPCRNWINERLGSGSTSRSSTSTYLQKSFSDQIHQRG
ncbi:MAG TPA: acyltransferase [Cyclobacteriaceae bacterium]|nr:acyltransferase [Cyclobacteriaceae bacterium]